MAMTLSAALLKETAESLIALANERGKGLLDEGVLRLPERLDKGRLTLAVLGQFKRGKSTLINALLGAPVMPSSVLPLTSVVTSVRYGLQPKLLLHFLDGREQEAPVEQLQEFVTEEKNPKNEKGVAWARVDWPCPFLDRPVRVVDTPGVGSVYDHNTETSEAFLGQLDAAVFVLGVDPVLTQTEIEWLAKVKDRAERFFFVLNKSDQLRPEEVEQVLSFTRAKLRDLWDREGRIFPLSARRALEDPSDKPFADFRKELETFLDQEGADTLLKSSRRKLENGVKGFISVLAMERGAAEKPEEELRARLSSLKLEEEGLDLERSRGYWVLEQVQGKALGAVKALLDEAWEAKRDQVKSHLERAWDETPTVGKGRSAVVHALQQSLEELFSPLRGEAEAIAEEGFQKGIEYLTNQYQAILDRLLQTAGEWFNLEMPPVTLEVPAPPKSRFYVHVPPELAGLSSAGGSIINLLPSKWGGAFAKRALLKKVELFYSMQRDRLLSDMAERMQEQGGVVVTELQSVISSVLARLRDTIERGLALHASTEAEKQAAVARLASDEARAHALLARITV
ncbi:MAG: dynamin family protein [Acidobacteria bacterium]|jgi:hypothetical protein|nr:dynamin family protein [Acidobacteriota bacterium]